MLFNTCNGSRIKPMRPKLLRILPPPLAWLVCPFLLQLLLWCSLTIPVIYWLLDHPNLAISLCWIDTILLYFYKTLLFAFLLLWMSLVCVTLYLSLFGLVFVALFRFFYGISYLFVGFIFVSVFWLTWQ